MAELSPSSTTLLLLVSDPLMRHVLADALRSAGYLVVVAADLGEAVDRLREVRPHLLITRPYISSMPGRTAAEYLRTKCHGLPVLIVAGYMQEDRVRSQNAIADFHIFPAPFSQEDLFEGVKAALHASHRH